jgi:hypothetical protein
MSFSGGVQREGVDYWWVHNPLQIAYEDAFISYMTTEIPPAAPEAMRIRDIKAGRLAVEG